MRGTPSIQKGFTDGLNTVSSPYEVERSETRECLNVVSTTRGAIRKRYGSTVFTTSLPNVELNSLFSCTVAGIPYLIAAGGGSIYAVDASGTVTEIGKGFTSGKRWSMVQAPASTTTGSTQGPVYMSNATDKAQWWSGALEANAVKEWKGLNAAPKIKDGKVAVGATTLQSKEASFLASDTNLPVKFETAVKVKTEAGAKTIAEATIEAVLSPTEVKLAISEEGWEALVENVNFTIERSYYSSSPNVPQGKHMIFAGNRIWMTGISEDPSAVRFSDFADIGEGGAQADPASWPGTNVVRFDSSDGKPITGIGTVGPYVVVFKESKTWIIHNLNDGENRKLSDTIGCVAQRSIVETQNGTFFLTSEQGIYLTDGSSLREMSYKVRPTILAINGAHRSEAAGTYYNNHYYLSFCSGVSIVANRTLDYDLQLKSWWLHDLTGNQWAQFEPTAGATALYAIPPKTKGGVVQAFVEGVYEDSGAIYPGNGTFSAFWISAWEPFGQYIQRHRIDAPFIKKRMRQIAFDGEGEITPVVFKNFHAGGQQEPGVVGNNPQWKPVSPINFSEGEQIFGNEDEEQTFGGETYKGVEMLFGGTAEVQAARLYALGVARVWSVGWGNHSNKGFTVDSFMYAISYRKS